MVQETKSQQMALPTASGVRWISLPAPDAEVLPGVRWGAFDVLFTPAFWAGRAHVHAGDAGIASYRLGSTLREEVAACLLGGYGIPAEVGLAAYDRLRASGLLSGQPCAGTLEDMLTAPLRVCGRSVRYRFAKQKARYLAACLEVLGDAPTLPEDDCGLRDYLMKLPGLGPKTALWITRNWTGSDCVAIVDVHICRACVVAGVFPQGSTPSRNYFALEQRFLAFSEAIGARPSILDNLMWQTMRKIGHLAPGLPEAAPAC